MQSSMINVLSSTGTKVLSEYIQGERLQFDLSDLSNGLYMIQVINNNGSVSTFRVTKH